MGDFVDEGDEEEEEDMEVASDAPVLKLVSLQQFFSPSVPDPGSGIRCFFYPLDPGSGSGMNFFRIPEPRVCILVRFF
jgi:hypothetical protein